MNYKAALVAMLKEAGIPFQEASGNVYVEDSRDDETFMMFEFKNESLKDITVFYVSDITEGN